VAFSHRESRRGALEEAESIRSLGRRAFTGPADARVPGEMAAFVDEAAATLGGIDFLVNNVGVFRRVPPLELSEEVLDEAFDVNVKAAVMAARAAVPHIRKRGGGAIVNVSSLGAARPWPFHLAYCASKAALDMVVRVAAAEWAPEVRVNAVAPGVTDTPMLGRAPRDGDWLTGVQERTALGGLGSSEDVARAVLALHDLPWVTGQVLQSDGGLSLHSPINSFAHLPRSGRAGPR
jgi:NAD(P)-dependent dehydrogenase (short-subunit alcohol dehydrogenase family)